MSEPQIILGYEAGEHNSNKQTVKRLTKGKTYKDLSTVIVIPTRGVIPARVVECWMGMFTPMNQKATRIFISGMEVGAAYNAAVELILAHPELSKWKYMLALEEDNMPPPDGLLRLYESMDKYEAVGGLYWTKGEEGQPMIYGAPGGILNFVPQKPIPDTVQECNGLGMGFTLFKIDTFRKMEKPWFRTVQEWTPGVGARGYTQDLFHFENMRKAGYRVACDTRVKVGHLDPETGKVW